MKINIILFILITLTSCYQKDDLEGSASKIEKIQTMYQEYKKDFPEVEDIQVKDVSRNTILLDIRTPRERAVSTIAGSISKENFESNMDFYKNKDIITFCTVGYRSGIYAQELMEEGYRVKNLVGGVLMWAHDGRVFLTPEGKKTKNVHVYGKQWDLVPQDYKSEY